MADDYFDIQQAADGIAHLQLNRPERLNTFAPPFFPALRDAVLQLNAEGRTRVLVISSTGKHFSAGMALDVFAGGSPSTGRPEMDSAPSGGPARSAVGGQLAMLDTGSARTRLAFQDSLRQLMRCFDVIEEARFPVIAAIQGGCIGGALDLAAACCLRVASADAFFTVQEIHIGMAADLGVLQRLPKIVPPAVARELAYTGERLGAERALAVGLVNAVRPDAASTLAHAMQLAASIAAKSPLAVAGSKLAINYAVDHPTADALQQMALLQSAIFDLDEMALAIRAWKTKTAAAFDGLAPVSAV
jgi:enoyl-CoA hydratase